MKPPNSSRSLSAEAARSELYALLHQTVSTKQAIQKVVEIGTAYLEVDHGHITSVDQAEDRWEVIGSTDPSDGPYPDGLTANLSGSYCRRTFQQSTPLALHDAGNQGWGSDQAYQLHQLDTYLGIRVDVFGEPYGTICFVDSTARETPFSETEQIFIELASQILQKILEETHHKRDLANRDQLISVLNRVLRHNLRNDLNVVQGYAQLLIENTSGEEARMASRIKSKAASLHSLGDKARALEALTRNVPVPRPMDIVPLVDSTVTELCEATPAVDCSLETPEQAVSFAAPQLAVALSELLENAAKHAGDDPSIDVAVQQADSRVTVTIADDGPGLPAAESRILTGASEEPLFHGSGLGLTLVYWTVTNLDGEVDVNSASSGSTIELHLQRAE